MWITPATSPQCGRNCNENCGLQYPIGLGADNVYDLDRICREISEADIIALQEVDRYW